MIINFTKKEEMNIDDKKAIAQIIKDGFWGKMANFFKRADNNETLNVLEESITFDKGFYYKEDGIVLGVVLLSTKKIPYLHFGKSARKKLGFWNATLLQIGFATLNPKYSDGLKLEMIAVSPEARGKGVGTKMFDHLYKIAKNEGFQILTLEVIDSNKKAKDLYTRLGYKEVKYSSSALFTRNMGFNGSFTMQKSIE